MINKSGQLGKIISSNFVLVILFFFALTYLIFVGFAVGIKKPEVPAVKESGLDDVLLEEIEVNGERISLADGIVKADLDSKKEEKAGRKSNYMSLVKEAIKTKLEKQFSEGEY